VLVFASIPIPNEANPPSKIVNDRILWLALAKQWDFWKCESHNITSWAFYASNNVAKVNSNSIQAKQLECILCYLVVGVWEMISLATSPWT
jgi:hypothetical protein